MAKTENIGLFKYDAELDKDKTFNIDTALNENWEKIDMAFINVMNNMNGLYQEFTEEIEQFGPLIDKKVDKVDGKELTDNNYTDAEKQKLATLENYDDTAVRDELNNKVNKIDGKELSSNDYTDAEKEKLATLKNYDDTALRNEIAQKAELNHEHDNYEPKVNKNTGYNLNKSDSVISDSDLTLATSKAVKTAYDKGTSALNMANVANNKANSNEAAINDLKNNSGIKMICGKFSGTDANDSQRIYLGIKPSAVFVAHTTYAFSKSQYSYGGMAVYGSDSRNVQITTNGFSSAGDANQRGGIYNYIAFFN